MEEGDGFMELLEEWQWQRQVCEEEDPPNNKSSLGCFSSLGRNSLFNTPFERVPKAVKRGEMGGDPPNKRPEAVLVDRDNFLRDRDPLWVLLILALN